MSASGSAPASTPDAAAAVDARGIARRFGRRWVLRGLTLRVEPGEVVALLGANGSGKTTFLRILTTLLRPSAGQAMVCGRDLVSEADAVRRSIGFLGHRPGLYDDLTARENLRFSAAMLGCGEAGVDPALERVGLTRAAHERTRDFSAGMQRRLALARVLLSKPRLLLFDEPYANLDADGVALVNELIADATAGGAAALMALHELTPAAGILARTATIRDGRLAPPEVLAMVDRAPRAAAGGGR